MLVNSLFPSVTFDKSRTGVILGLTSISPLSISATFISGFLTFANIPVAKELADYSELKADWYRPLTIPSEVYVPH